MSGEFGGETNETPSNSFTPPSCLRENPSGKRIDYVLYTPGPNIEAATAQCSLPLPDKVPGEDFSYSDHEGVFATIRLRRKSKEFQSAPEFRRQLSVNCRGECVRNVTDAVNIIQNSRRHVLKDKLNYSILAAFFLVLFIASFLPSVLVELQPEHFIVLDVILFFPRVILTVLFVFFVLMSTLFNKRELNALNSAEKSLFLIVNQDKFTPLS